MESQFIWKPPAFDTSGEPTLLHEAHLTSDHHFEENFARSVKWCAFNNTLFHPLLLNPSRKGAQTVLSLLHTVRIAVCNISTCAFAPTLN
jgi:hypothetical protein